MGETGLRCPPVVKTLLKLYASAAPSLRPGAASQIAGQSCPDSDSVKILRDVLIM